MLQQDYPYIQSWKTKMFVALILFGVSAFIILFLEPFKTSESNKFIVAGYSACIIICYGLSLLLETSIFKKKQLWKLINELSIMLFILAICAISVYWYDLRVIKNEAFYWSRFGLFTIKITIPFAVILIPLLMGLRYYFGAFFQKPDEYMVTLKGSNKSDVLEIDFRKIYYIQSSNNYILVKYIQDDSSFKQQLIRCTLSQATEQLPSFVKCHRSFLINPKHLKSIQKHQKKAFLQLQLLEEEIPISKSYYSNIKNYLTS